MTCWFTSLEPGRTLMRDWYPARTLNVRISSKLLQKWWTHLGTNYRPDDYELLGSGWHHPFPMQTPASPYWCTMGYLDARDKVGIGMGTIQTMALKLLN